MQQGLPPSASSVQSRTNEGNSARYGPAPQKQAPITLRSGCRYNRGARSWRPTFSLTYVPRASATSEGVGMLAMAEKKPLSTLRTLREPCVCSNVPTWSASTSETASVDVRAAPHPQSDDGGVSDNIRARSGPQGERPAQPGAYLGLQPHV